MILGMGFIEMAFKFSFFDKHQRSSALRTQVFCF